MSQEKELDYGRNLRISTYFGISLLVVLVIFGLVTLF